jgi:hypothetical protein
MTATLTALREAMTDFLAGQGLRALSAWPGTERLVRAAPLAVVRMKGVEAEPLGFQNYLGQAYDQDAGRWRDRYGQRITAVFGLDLYSPRTAGEEGCRLLLDQAAGAFQAGGPGGLTVERWSMDEPVFDRESGMFRGELTAVCRGTLETVAREDGSFLGFEVKGGLQT